MTTTTGSEDDETNDDEKKALQKVTKKEVVRTTKSRKEMEPLLRIFLFLDVIRRTNFTYCTTTVCTVPGTYCTFTRRPNDACPRVLLLLVWLHTLT